MEKHLKPEQHYRDLYDRHTVERCRRTENLFDEKIFLLADDQKVDVETLRRVREFAKNFSLRGEAGERYLNKEKTIQEWMEADRKKDELYESAVAPENIRCLTCRNKMKPTFKDLWTEYKKPDRVLFMYECPNKCLPSRAFFSDGQEWRAKPDLCPKCDNNLNRKTVEENKKFITTYNCPKCGHTYTEEYESPSLKVEGDYDDKFAFDRDRFCLTDENGRRYEEEKSQMERMGKLTEEWKEEVKLRSEKLAANPGGFHLDGSGYTCFICGGHTSEGDNWYDQYGIKCLVCQKAVDDGEIPAYLAKEKDAWYSKYELESRFNLKGPALKKWIKEGIIKARTVSRYGKGVHVQIFLIEDNKDFLPPKKLTESQSVRERKGGKDWTWFEPWYKFVDPKEHLKEYKIINFLKVSVEDTRDANEN